MAESASPTTAPTDTPASLKSLLRQLGDSDPSVRDATREQLMAMPSTDLPALRAALAAMRPLPPGVAQAMHDIVTHVYLSGEISPGPKPSGFMGIGMVRDDQSVYPDDDQGDTQLPLGVIVDMRLPGFDAYRVLRDGDIITMLSTDESGPIAVHSSLNICGAVAQLSPGEHVRLKVLRNGRRIDVTLVLNQRPIELPLDALVEPEAYRNDRQKKAEKYWNDQFASVLDPSIS
jgi:hypothetical protein